MDILNLTEEEIEELQRIEDNCPVPVGAGRRPQVWPPVSAKLIASEKQSLLDGAVREKQEAQAG
jgi:hypothetical protein